MPAAAAGVAPASSGVAHSEQNFAPGVLDVPQFGQAAASGVAHSEQNFAPGRFSVPQFGQITLRRIPRQGHDIDGTA
jgi:hypothetical protein